MYNLLIALGVGALAFGVGVLVTGATVAGIVPAVLASGIAYFLLMRRSGKQLAVISEQAMAIFQDKMATARTPQQQKAIFQEGKAVLEQGFALGRWQFMVAPQIHAQLGTLSYMQQDFAAAREHLTKGDSLLARYTAWQPMAMLALVEHRDGDTAAAIKRLQGLSVPGSRDPLYWGILAFLAHRDKQTDVALKAVSDGLDKHADSQPLQTLADQLRNKKRLTPEVFGQGWLQFFPEDAQRVFQANPALQQQMMAAMGGANGATGPGQPMNRAQRRAARKGKGGTTPPQGHPRF
jgi:hypothetical protein